MKAIIFLLFILFSSQISYAQNVNFVWAKQMGGTEVGVGASITVDAAGNVFTTGSFKGTIDFDPGPGTYNLTATGNTCTFVSKLDSSGNFVWAKQIGGNTSLDSAVGLAIAFDASGNIYTTGFFTGTVDFDPGPGTFPLSSFLPGYLPSFVLKLDPAGNFVWAKQMGGEGTDWGAGFSIAIDAAGNVYTAGIFQWIADFDPGPGIFNLDAGWVSIYISKLDSDGNFIWAKAPQKDFFGNILDEVKISMDASGNIYCTGDFAGLIDFDPGPGVFYLNSVNNSWDIYVWKLAPDGNFIWAKQMGGPGLEGGSQIALDPQGNIYTTGWFWDTVDFDPGPGIYDLTPIGGTGQYISKLNSGGDFVWAKQAQGGPIATDTSGNIYIASGFTGTVDFDPGAGAYDLTAIGNYDLCVYNLNTDGNFIWAKQMGGPGIVTDGRSIALDAYGNIYTTGNFNGTVDFDPGVAVYNLSAFGDYDIFVHKMSQCTNRTSSTINASACRTYTLNGQTYTATGVYIQTLINAAGCDSIITLNLTINNRYTTFSASACDSYSWNSQTYTSTGTYKDTLLAANGCDSIITLNLVINSRSFSSINAVICKGENYEGYSTTGTYIDTLSAANSCDSIRTLNLTVNSTSFSTIDTSICSGRNYAGYTRTGIYIDTLIAANGCDSLRTIHLTVKNNCGIYIPNAFTPNNNSLNDLFIPIINLPFQQYSFVIFNRYGQKVFETREYGKGWDGTFKGKDQPTGSYVYRVTYANLSGWESVENGTVLLIR